MANAKCWWIGETLPREFAVSVQRLLSRYRVVVSPRTELVQQLLTTVASEAPAAVADAKNVPEELSGPGLNGPELSGPELNRPELSGLESGARELSRRTCCGSVVVSWAERQADAGRRFRAWFPPQLIVWAQRYPHEVPQCLVERTRVLWPNTRQLVLTGSWSDSEGRTGKPLVGLERQPAVTWMNLAGWESCVAADGAERARCVVILSAQAAWAEAMSGGLGSAGWIVVWGRRLGELLVRQPSVVLIDLARQEVDRHAQIAEARRHFPELPLVGMLAFPRPHEVAQLRAQGVSTILPQPVSLEALLAVLDRAAGQSDSVLSAAGTK